jgi:zona occludens toxin
MIYLYTGVPGAGKTLNAIKFVKNNKEWADRSIYYFNIRDLDPGLGWEEITDDQVKAWADLPDGSLVIVDECQAIFPQRDAKTKVPGYISQLNTHRHRGFDFVLVTQHPRLIDTAVRRLVGLHRHIDRRYGQNHIHVYTFQECEERIENRKFIKDCDKERLPLDKKIFGLYKSAEIHTHKRTYPKKLIAAVIAIPLLISGVVYAGYSVFDNYSDGVSLPGSVDQVASSSSPVPSSGSLFSPGGSEKFDFHSIQSRVPRLEGLPWTAPRYDKLMEPKMAPKPAACIVMRGQCGCFTQQATPLDVHPSLCIAIVKEGYFDDTKDPADYDDIEPSPRGEGREPHRGGDNQEIPGDLQFAYQETPGDLDQWGRPSDVVSRPGQYFRKPGLSL